MATTVARSVFVDTNVLVYANIARAPLHAVALQAIVSREQAGIELWMSRQVLREYLATLTRPQAYGTSTAVTTLTAQTPRFEARFHVADDDARVTAGLLAIMSQISIGGKQVHDANIVATMQVHGANHLLTHNAADFARFAHLITVVPLM